jgi:PAS domain S-box-containing protein
MDPRDITAGIVLTAVDISDRKQAEEALLELNAELENRVVERTAELMDPYNNAPCGYHSLDENGHFILINDTELNMFGFERRELIGQRFLDIITPESEKTFEKSFPVFKERGWIKDFEFNVVKKDGSVLPILVNATAVKDASGKYLYSRSTVLDNSARKEAEEKISILNKELEARAQKLQSINKELESFSYSISHDLKAPLRGIEGYSNLLLDDYSDKLDADGRTFLHSIHSGTIQMGQLVDDLLAYSRLERRALITDNILIPLFVEKLLLRYVDEIESRNISLTVALLEIVISADADGLGMALRNLIEKAFKFTRDVSMPMIAICCNETEKQFII